uniref:alpha-amylase n=1 Tax=Sinocyclocheilus anshuiensis TaxID=1608454 RepID=A0A671REX6_9TELE
MTAIGERSLSNIHIRSGRTLISPPSESIVVTNPWHPWWQRYQPIGYNLCSRSGNENELRDMITWCNNVGVNINDKQIINHMCGAGGGAGTHSSCGSYFDANKKDFPTVPYSNLDFNDGKCNTGSGNTENYQDIKNCHLVGLLDLALEKDYVRGKVASFMNKLIDMGVAGFRVDVIDLGGEPITSGEYTGIGRVTEFKYGAKLGNVIRKWNGEKLSFVKNWGEGWGFMSSDKALVFVDNHDNQRGHAFMLAHPYGFTRVMSSYQWDRNIVNGQVDDQAHNGDGSTKPVPINPDSTCGDGWVCEHRWRQIKNMVAFRNVVNGQAFSNWWDNGSNQISFSCGNKGFLVINNDDWELNATLNTSLPGGTYCDVISGQKENGRCTGKQVVVGGDGRVTFKISTQEEDPFMAIHTDSKL